MPSVKTLIKQAKTLGGFGKGTDKAAQVSPSRSAEDNCDDVCRWKNNGCYAEPLEIRYPSLGNKLDRHQKMPPQNLCNLAAYELSQFDAGSLDWFRVAVNGSLPMPAEVRENKEFHKAFHNMIEEAIRATGDPGRIHIPVESYSKRRFYQSLVADLGVVVRESLQGTWLRRIRALKHPASVVVGEGLPVAEREAECQKVADQVRSWGRRPIVCPAVIRDSKCGKCRGCGSENVDLVIYPLHK